MEFDEFECEILCLINCNSYLKCKCTYRLENGVSFPLRPYVYRGHVVEILLKNDFKIN